jgi:hypothetical protein
MKGTLFLAVFALSATVAQAQGFSSGSTGADGPLFLSCGGGGTSLQVPPSGVFNWTTVTIQNLYRPRFPGQVSECNPI